MAPPSFPSKRTLLRATETLAIAAAGGAALSLVGFPAGLVTGSLLAVAVAALLGRPVMVPAPLSRVILVLVGISLGAAVTPETLQGLARYPLSIAVLALATLSMIGATSFYLRYVHGWDARSALFGASPGALAQVMALSSEYRADLPAIAIVQTMRVVALTIGIPSGLALFGLTATGGFMPRMAAAGSGSLLELAILVAVAIASALAVWRLRLPGGLLFGSMLGSGVLHGTGWITVTLPWWVSAAAIVSIGALTGSRFANTGPRTLLRFLGAALGSFAVAIAVASLFVLILTALLPVRIADAVVAFAPGAQDTMMVLALALHLDPVFVAAHHLSRFLLVSLLVPFLAHRIRQTPAKRERAPSSHRPTIED
jgi:membrane AbrB-like protein